MFGVVEFEAKECAVVPYSWIEETKCCWPPCPTREALRKWVIKEKQPSNSWKRHEIVKLHKLTESFQEAEECLVTILERYTTDASSASNNAIVEYSRKRPAESDESEYESDESNKRAKLGDTTNEGSEQLDLIGQPGPSQGTSEPPQTNARGCDQYEGSPITTNTSASRNDNLEPRIKKPQTTCSGERQNSQSNLSMIEQLSIRSDNVARREIPENNYTRQRGNNNYGTSPFLPNGRSTPGNDIPSRVDPLDLHNGEHDDEITRSISAETYRFQAFVVRSLYSIIAKLENNEKILANMLRIQQVQGANTASPDNMPSFPLKGKREFKAFEKFLNESEHNYQYLKIRLATIGGTNVRTCTMNVLKFLMTNKLAMAYNWSGREKRPFKSTKTMEVIADAIRYAFRHNTKGELTDSNINSAVKDWLKLARARYEYDQRKGLPKA